MMQQIVVLRWGHRIHRDARLTTHVALAARALGASGFLLADTEDSKIKATLIKISENWGGDFLFEMGKPWREEVKGWRAKGGIVVHLTAYGENIQGTSVLTRIRKTNRDILLLVGSQKVPREFYAEEVSHFNVSVGNQPHSECAAVAIFLDRFFKGKELNKKFKSAKMKIVPQTRGKKILVKQGFSSKN